MMNINEAIEILIRQESIAREQYKSIDRRAGKKIEEDQLVDDYNERVWLRGFLEACYRYRNILIELQQFNGSTSTSLIDFLNNNIKSAGEDCQRSVLRGNKSMARDYEWEQVIYRNVYNFVMAEKEKEVK